MKKNKKILSLLIIASVIITSCQKEIRTNNQPAQLQSTNSIQHGHLTQTNTYSSDVAVAWMNMEIQLMKTATGIPNIAFARPYAYSGLALYETVVGGMPAYQSIAPQLNGLSNLPQTDNGLAYHWPSAANAALAFMSRSMFPTTSAANKISIDSLENALNSAYSGQADEQTISRSITFGKEIAQKIFDWSETDGYLHANDPYTPPSGPGLWVPTPPAFAAASTPYWGNLRMMVPGSGNNAQAGPPTPYSEDPSSDFYKMVKQVYDVSQTLTPEQTAQGLFWRDLPGVSAPGHHMSILEQVIQKQNSSLDIAAYAWVLSGIAVFDASISCWRAKYHYNLVRPITYIRSVLGFTTWSSLISTPTHPEYPAAHAFLSAANADVLTHIFGDNYSFTDHTYDYLGFAPRSFNSFNDYAVDAGNSRLYAGIHYLPSINTGLALGKTVAQNVINSLKFLKE